MILYKGTALSAQSVGPKGCLNQRSNNEEAYHRSRWHYRSGHRRHREEDLRRHAPVVAWREVQRGRSSPPPHHKSLALLFLMKKS